MRAIRAIRSGGSRKDTGHTLICGPTGSGKTVFIGFLIAMLDRQGVTQVVFDKDRGLEILVRALGGEYFPLKNGEPTGFNPLQLPPTPLNVEFLKIWLGELSRVPSRDGGRHAPTVREQADLEQALRGTLALEPPARRLSRLVEFLDPTDPEGLYARLTPLVRRIRRRLCVGVRQSRRYASPRASTAIRSSGSTSRNFSITR